MTQPMIPPQQHHCDRFTPGGCHDSSMCVVCNIPRLRPIRNVRDPWYLWKLRGTNPPRHTWRACASTWNYSRRRRPSRAFDDEDL